MNDETLELIQTKIAFLERATAELSDMIFRQHREIQTLEAQLKAITDRLSGAQTDDTYTQVQNYTPTGDISNTLFVV